MSKTEGHWLARIEKLDAYHNMKYTCNCGYARSDKSFIQNHIEWKVAELQSGAKCPCENCALARTSPIAPISAPTKAPKLAYGTSSVRTPASEQSEPSA